MKKTLSILLAIALLLCGLAALAEEAEKPGAAHDFLGEWVDQNGTCNIDIAEHESGDGYVITITRDVLDAEDYDYLVWAYAGVYDEASRSLRSTSCVKGTGRYDEEDESIEFVDEEAEFRFDDDNLLVWDDKAEDAGAGMVFEHTIGWVDPDFVGPGHHFAGEWNAERVSVVIEERMDEYAVLVSGANGASEGTMWAYVCRYDPETDSLFTPENDGWKIDYAVDENGDYTETLVYEDGAAVFTINDDGELIWEDRKEDAGADRPFAPVEPAEAEAAVADIVIDDVFYADPEEEIAFLFNPDAFEIGMDDLTEDEHLVILTGKQAEWGDYSIRFHLRDLAEGEAFPALADFAEIEAALNTTATQGEWNGFPDTIMYAVDDDASYEMVFVVPVCDGGEPESVLTINVYVSDLEDEYAGMARDDAISAVLDTLELLDAVGDAESSAPDPGDDTQNPVMNFVGEYACDRAFARVEALGAKEALITIEWGGSAWEQARWVITGPFDTETLTVRYTDCVKSILTYDEGGELTQEEVAYEDGTGWVAFGEDGAFTWHDDLSEGEDMVFEWAPLADGEE